MMSKKPQKSTKREKATDGWTNVSLLDMEKADQSYFQSSKDERISDNDSKREKRKRNCSIPDLDYDNSVLPQKNKNFGTTERLSNGENANPTQQITTTTTAHNRSSHKNRSLTPKKNGGIDKLTMQTRVQSRSSNRAKSLNKNQSSQQQDGNSRIPNKNQNNYRSRPHTSEKIESKNKLGISKNQLALKKLGSTVAPSKQVPMLTRSYSARSIRDDLKQKLRLLYADRGNEGHRIVRDRATVEGESKPSFVVRNVSEPGNRRKNLHEIDQSKMSKTLRDILVRSTSSESLGRTNELKSGKLMGVNTSKRSNSGNNFKRNRSDCSSDYQRITAGGRSKNIPLSNKPPKNEQTRQMRRRRTSSTVSLPAKFKKETVKLQNSTPVRQNESQKKSCEKISTHSINLFALNPAEQERTARPQETLIVECPSDDSTQTTNDAGFHPTIITKAIELSRTVETSPNIDEFHQLSLMTTTDPSQQTESSNTSAKTIPSLVKCPTKHNESPSFLKTLSSPVTSLNLKKQFECPEVLANRTLFPSPEKEIHTSLFSEKITASHAGDTKVRPFSPSVKLNTKASIIEPIKTPAKKEGELSVVSETRPSPEAPVYGLTNQLLCTKRLQQQTGFCSVEKKDSPLQNEVVYFTMAGNQSTPNQSHINLLASLNDSPGHCTADEQRHSTDAQMLGDHKRQNSNQGGDCKETESSITEMLTRAKETLLGFRISKSSSKKICRLLNVV